MEQIRIEDFHIGFEYEEYEADIERYLNKGFVWVKKVYSFNSPRLHKIQKLIDKGLVRFPDNSQKSFPKYRGRGNHSVNQLEKLVEESIEIIRDKQYKIQEYEETVYLNEKSQSDFQLQFTECTVKEAPLEVDIIFQTSIGAYHVGKRFMPTQNSNKPIYQDYKKYRIRKNVIKWGLLP